MLAVVISNEPLWEEFADGEDGRELSKGFHRRNRNFAPCQLREKETGQPNPEWFAYHL